MSAYRKENGDRWPYIYLNDTEGEPLRLVMGGTSWKMDAETGMEAMRLHHAAQYQKFWATVYATYKPITQEALFYKLNKYIRRRPGIVEDYNGNYADAKSDMNRASKQRVDALEQLQIFRGIEFDAAKFLYAAREAYSGRFEVNQEWEFHHCAGQYEPTKYRAAVAEVLRLYNRLMGG